MTEQQLLRMAKRRLAILRHPEEVTGNVALTCRYDGISRQAFDTWRQRVGARYFGRLIRPAHTHGSAHRADLVGQPFRPAG